ncbi:MAG: type IV conjugative transfer system coupling protein TraD [Candidatus Thiodiazotropha taylori]
MAVGGNFPLQSLLRPPVELYTAMVAVPIGGLLIYSPYITLLTPTTAMTSGGLMIIAGCWRALQGFKVIRYRKRLTRLPRYALTSRKIPVSKQKLFLGKGFIWKQIHVQRLRDIRLFGDQYTQQSGLNAWMRSRPIAWENTWLLKRVGDALLWDSPLNPWRPRPDIGGKPEIHAVGLLEGERDQYQDLSERVGHTLVLGTTRVGKTRLAEILITQDIHRGDVVIVFDPKGDAELMTRTFVEARKAGRPCYIFHLGYPDISARYNAVGNFERVTEVATRISDQLPSQGNSAAFKEFAWRFVNIVARALVALGKRPDYNLISRYIFNIDPLLVEYGMMSLSKNAEKGWEQHLAMLESDVDEKKLPQALKGRNHTAVAILRYTQQKEIYDPILDGLLGAFRYDRTYYDKIISSVGPLLEKLTTGQVAELIAPDYFNLKDERPIFDWYSAIQQRAVVYVGLDCLSDAIVGGAVGASMFADLTSVSGRIYKHGTESQLPDIGEADPKLPPPKIALHGDEFNELVGSQFIPMINKAGGSGFQFTGYTQTGDDIIAGIGDVHKAGVIQGNFNTLIMLRVKNKQTSEFLTNQLPTVQISQHMLVSGVNDSSDPDSDTHFTSRNEDRITTQDVPMLEPADLTALPKGQAFAFIEGGKLLKLRLPLPVKEKDDLPSDMKRVAQAMRDTYKPTTPENWYAKAEPDWWGGGQITSSNDQNSSGANFSGALTEMGSDSSDDTSHSNDMMSI